MKKTQSQAIMKQIELTRGKFASIDDEDFELVNRYKWQARPRGNRNREVWYASNRGGIFMHRLIMGLVKGDGLEVDHIDHDPLNNQKSNLRIVNHQQNCLNWSDRNPSEIATKGWTIERRQRAKGHWHQKYGSSNGTF